MADAKEKGLSLLSSTASVNLNAAADTETSLYTVPTGKTAVVVMAVIRSLSADTGAAVVTLGKTGGTCDQFLGDQTLSNITASYADQCLILQPVPNATPVASLVLDAAEAFGIEITTAAGSACTCTVDVFGFIF